MCPWHRIDGSVNGPARSRSLGVGLLRDALRQFVVSCSWGNHWLLTLQVPEGDEKEVEERKMPTSSTVIDDADRGVQLEVLIEGAGPDVILVP
jgi:hypothetical protein